MGWGQFGKEYCKLGSSYYSAVAEQTAFGSSKTYGLLGNPWQVRLIYNTVQNKTSGA